MIVAVMYVGYVLMEWSRAFFMVSFGQLFEHIIIFRIHTIKLGVLWFIFFLRRNDVEKRAIYYRFLWGWIPNIEIIHGTHIISRLSTLTPSPNETLLVAIAIRVWLSRKQRAEHFAFQCESMSYSLIDDALLVKKIELCDGQREGLLLARLHLNIYIVSNEVVCGLFFFREPISSCNKVRWSKLIVK